jgi:predicted P-loop ATPase/GTPase
LENAPKTHSYIIHSSPFEKLAMPQPMSQVNASASDSRTAQVQQQVNDVVGIMNQNIGKVMERGEKLNTIQNKTEELQQGAITFKKTSKEVKDKLYQLINLGGGKVLNYG